LKIAFATVFDPRDVNRGSGTFYHLGCEIEHHGHTVHYIGPLQENHLPLQTRIIRGLEKRAGKRYKTYLDPFYCQARAREASQWLADLEYDFVLTNDFGLAAFIQTSKPIVLYTDAMIPIDYRASDTPHQSRVSNLGFVGTYLFQRTIRKGLDRSSLCFFPTQWIADEALKYGISDLKVRVVPFGANIDDPGPDVAESRKISRVLDKGQIDLLFVGKDWNRKGGDIAVKVVYELNRRGIKAVLHIVGATSPQPVEPQLIRSYGLLDKSIEADWKQLDSLYRSCDAFLLPSSSEGFVIVVLEAAAYGLPVIAFDIDGIRNGVKHQVSGYLIPPSANENAFADLIATWFDTTGLYTRLVTGARTHFTSEVNWKSSVTKLLARVSEVMKIEGFS
jgi:glycosyltransferase involved in cell wall biosynthesis